MKSKTPLRPSDNGFCAKTNPQQYEIFSLPDSYPSIPNNVIDVNNKQITKGDYKNMWWASPDLLDMMERASGKSFYLKIETGEELRKVDR